MPTDAAWRESQLQAMLALGDAPQDAERVLAAMEKLSPDDPRLLPDAEAFAAMFGSVSADDIRDAQADWMVRARPEWKRLLTATIRGLAEGGPGSGNWGHAGVKGQHGGSAPKSGAGAAMSTKTGKDAAARQAAAKSGDGTQTQAMADANNKALSDLLPNNWEDMDSGTAHAAAWTSINAIASTPGLDADDAELVSRKWAASSNDSDMTCLGIQEAAAAEFGVPLSDFTKGRIAEIESEHAEHLEAARKYASNGGKPTEAQINRWMDRQYPEDTNYLGISKQRAALRGCYERTQSRLREMGIKPDDEVTLYRGVMDYDNVLPVGRNVQVKGNALESWTVSRKITDRFSNDNERGRVISARVKARDIVSIPATGIGTAREAEVVILGSNAKLATVEAQNG